ncbi:hypothetical protein ASPSYDRAFT_507153 [Aspergillus sydowii CBS 593.65]|uniref:Hydrophobin n=1 Tax=Aspergillus sydowii CBS 593.65 TaxID=1036612 RepID=A0A1L9T3C2_9EURO|nr:uncharacterized protein ASPSYDRAFT_507153 [Aspergillus sydowii CBS 593.65]OJJ53885.1 hypothetical protein ASPSYDRAFT_507153 [Aspergillus sydowii CBS 593.65]
MHHSITPKSLLSLFLTLSPLATAFPYTTTTITSTTSSSSSSSSSSTLPPAAALSSSIAHETPIAFGAAGIKNNTATCPPSHASKQCCTNIGDQLEEVFGELGEVLPLVGDITANSRTGLSCNAVVENSECGLSLMCCSGKAGNPKKDDKTPSEGPQEPGTQTIFQSACISFNDAVELGKKEAAAAAAASASSSVLVHASASATPTPRSTSRMF